jgi:PIN domain nuclease of toxin-antitoxin system
MIVLDTHIWLWWIARDDVQLKMAWRERITHANQVGVSAISCFEVAWLVQHGRIELPEPLELWFDKALAGSGIKLVAITALPKPLRRCRGAPLRTGHPITFASYSADFRLLVTSA